MFKNDDDRLWISKKEALNLLKEHDRKITSSGLRYLSHKYDFERVHEDDFHREYNILKLKEYIELDYNNLIKDGFISIKDYSIKYDIPVSSIYYFLKKGIVEIQRMETLRKCFFNEKEFTKKYSEYKERKKRK